MLVTKIPAIGVHLELVKLFKIYGEIEDYKILDDYPSEEFTDTILLKFTKIQNARHIFFNSLFSYNLKLIFEDILLKNSQIETRQL